MDTQYLLSLIERLCNQLEWAHEDQMSDEETSHVYCPTCKLVKEVYALLHGKG